MIFRLGLTGSIGMGKSTTAQIFAEMDCAVWDADAAVHRLYAAGGSAVSLIQQEFPEAVKNAAVDRTQLKRILQNDPGALPRLESIVHPLVRKDRKEFMSTASADIVVLDIPLLFETGAQSEMDAVACVYVDAETQRSRVLARGTMSESQFEMILSKQMPIEQKLALSDYHIQTDTIQHARQQVAKIVKDIRGKRHA